MAKTKKVTRTTRRLTRAQVIDRILQVIQAFPEAVGLPDNQKTRAFWEKTFSAKNKPAAAVLEVIQELPAFTDQGPKALTQQGWAKVFANYMGLEQLQPTLSFISYAANFVPVKRPPIRYWREAYGKNEAVQRVRPRESNDYLPNPHRGTTTYQRFQGDELCPTIAWGDTYGPMRFTSEKKVRENVKYTPWTALAYCRWPWAWLEPEKGKFNWAPIDGTLKTAAERGQTAQIRFQPYTASLNTAKNPPKSKRFPPQTAVNVPDWYWDTGAAWLEQGPFAGHEIDSNDPLYVKHFGDFVRAFGQRYDGHPHLESVDIAYAGFWGEAGGNTTPETAAQLAQAYVESFHKTQLVGMLGSPGYTHALRAAAGEGRHVGWRADSFGDFHLGNVLDVPAELGWNHMFDNYVQGLHECGAQEAWKTAPVTMETSATVAHWVMQGLDLDRILYEGYRYHMSVFMPKSVFFPEKVMEKLIDFDKKIGYRFVLRHMLLPIEAKPGAKINVDVFLDNVGCAPIYRPYKLALRFKQGPSSYVVPFAEDIRRWLPGHNFVREELVFPPQLERGEVKLALGIVDDTHTARVRLAIEGPVDQGWHPLTSMDCVK